MATYDPGTTGVPLSTFAAANTPPSEMAGCTREEMVKGCSREPAALIVTWGVPGVEPSTRSTQANPYLSVRQVMVEVEVAGLQSGSPATLLKVTAPRGLTESVTPDPSTATPTAS